MEQPFSLPSDFSGIVRLFPLPDLVLFPNNAVPLHIFESRYVEMLEDAMRDDRLITMASLLPGHSHDYHSRPPIAPVVCIAEVTMHKKTDEGTYNLMIVGLHRARVEHEIEPVRSFRRASVVLMEDLPPPSDEEAAKLGGQLARQLLKNVPAGGDLVKAFKGGELSLGTLADILSYVLPLPLEVKLQLLAELDVARRARLLLASAQPTDTKPERGDGPGDFSLN